jgi:ABC-type enterobactin transport system permease subunit
VGAAVALHTDRFVINAAELPLGDVAVIAAQLLLGLELHAVVGELALAALAVLAGAIFAPVHRTFWAAPDILAHPAVEFVLGFMALGHSRPRSLAVVG